ncbi:MAG TPA: tail fiber domain-containing protein [Thermoanaerobaculia bacterium]|nr:tail fiber domain-containing protein [Thermoanaerobaculia bacterium]
MRKPTIAAACLLVPLALFGGFASTVSYLAAVGRVAGADGAQFYTTIWVTNLTTAPQTFTFEFLKGGQSNPSPASFHDTLQPGETKVYENVVETKLGLHDALGAARITSSGELFVAERIYNQQPGDDLGNTEGMFFAGVPKSFSISSGQSASIQGIDQGGAENFRYNFALIETGGGSPTVNIQVFDGSGTMLGQKSYPLQPYEQIQPSVADVVPNIHTTNARITATVTRGGGSIILAGAQLANESQDSSGFEMTFPDSLLGGGGGGGNCTLCVTSLNGLTGALTLKPGSGISITPSGSSISIAYTGGGGAGGITSVIHDGSLSGAGTGVSPLGIAGGGVGTAQLAGNAVQAGNIASGQVVKTLNGLHDAVTLSAGSNVTITPSGSTLTIASTGAGGTGLTLPFSGTTSSSNPAFAVTNTGSGRAIEGDVSNASPAVAGIGHGSGPGVYGENQSGGNAGEFTGSVHVGGTLTADNATAIGNISADNLSATGHGISSTSSITDGVYGTSTSGNGIYGNVSNSSAGVAGVNTGSGPGVYGENQSGGYAGDFVGDVIVAGSITYSGSLIHSSDARFKDAIEPIPDALESVLRLRGVKFDWRREEFPDRRFPAGTNVGFIAQEVESVLPSLVSTAKDGYEGVDYAALTPLLVEAIKAQQTQIEKKQRQIDDQARQIEDLTRRLESLEEARTGSIHGGPEPNASVVRPSGNMARPVLCSTD